MLTVKVLKEEYLQTKNISRFKKWLIKNHFKRIGEGAFSEVFSKPTLNFVVKLSDSPIEYPKHPSHPLYKSYVKPLYVDRSQKVMIQPKVNRNSKRKAHRLLLKKYKNKVDRDIEFYYDVHQDNVGWLNNKPVIFDCGFDYIS